MNEENFKKSIKKVFEEIDAPRSHFSNIFNQNLKPKKTSTLSPYGIFIRSLAFILPLALIFSVTLKDNPKVVDPITDYEILELISYEADMGFTDSDLTFGFEDYDLEVL